MELFTALFIILIAGFFQGSFMVPMGLHKGWKWENSWFLFSLLGMIALNWLLAFIFIPGLTGVYASVPSRELLVLSLFGLGWGCGSVLFGIGIDRLGLSLGYPVIQGLIALCGALIPLLILSPGEIISLKGLLLVCGAALVIFGIVICTRANTLKESGAASPKAEDGAPVEKKRGGALMIAIAAGILSSFPNVGATFGTGTIEAAQAAGASEFMAGNAVWAFFFTFGFIPNALYTAYLFRKNKSCGFFRTNFARNLGWGALMSAMWIGSFYLYGMGAFRMGAWGLIIGWPLYISFAIVTGNLWGLWRGEWKGTAVSARKKLNYGMFTIIAAMIVIGICNFF